MTRTERLLRLARQRGDLLAVATLEGGLQPYQRALAERVLSGERLVLMTPRHPGRWTEAELRESWGR